MCRQHKLTASFLHMKPLPWHCSLGTGILVWFKITSRLHFVDSSLNCFTSWMRWWSLGKKWTWLKLMSRVQRQRGATTNTTQPAPKERKRCESSCAPNFHTRLYWSGLTLCKKLGFIEGARSRGCNFVIVFAAPSMLVSNYGSVIILGHFLVKSERYLAKK